MFNIKILLPILGLSLAAGVATASPGEYETYYQNRGPVPFEALDLDRNGVVTAEEHAKVRSQRHAYLANRGYPMRNAANAPAFEQIDRDASGSISREELNQWRSQRMQQRRMGCKPW